MPNRMSNIMKRFLKMPYYGNYAAVSGAVHNIAKHEDAVEDILIAEGFKESKIEKVKITQRDLWLKDNSFCTMGNGTYISQPCGTHNSPDFIVKENDKVYFIECKSVKKGTPMLNSGFMKSGYIYVLSSERHDKSTIWLGQGIFTPEQQKLVENHIKEARERDKEFNEKLGNSHGIRYYTRPMASHKGSQSTTDYFLNPGRKKLEQKVLDYV